MLLSVLIVTFNAPAFAEQTVASVQRATAGFDAEVLLRDNAAPGDNIGFARANNELLKKAQGEFVLFLNPDVLLPEDGLRKAIHYLQANGNCGALGVRMIDGSGRFLPESKRNIPSVRSSVGRLFARSSGYYSSLNEFETGKVDVLPGAFFLTRRKLMIELGGFDEKFFMYGEDIDLSMRISQKGLHNIYFPEVTIIHFKGESTVKEDPVYRKRFFGAMKVYAEKYYGKVAAAVYKAGISIARVVLKSTKGTGSITDHRPAEMILVALKESDADAARTICLRNGIKTFFLPFTDTMQLPESPICFCTGELQMRDIIGHVSSKPDREFYFHQAGTRSIIGSPDKSTQGTVLS